MLEELTTSIKRLNTSTGGALFYVGAGAIVGRKFCIAGAYKLAGKVAEWMGRQQNAFEWNKTGNDYFKWAKKHAMRDLTAFAGFSLGLLLVKSIEGRIKIEEEADKIKESWINWVTATSLFLNIAHIVDLCTYTPSILGRYRPEGDERDHQPLYYPRGCFLWRWTNRFLIQPDLSRIYTEAVYAGDV
jgi:hypothetical protein